MITAVHALVFADDPEAARVFFRDVLQFQFVDTGGGWLIFKTGPSEVGVHPNQWQDGDTPGGTTQAFDLSLCCDDLAATMSELASRGAEFAGDVVEQSWGYTVELKIPGAGTMQLYQPKYPLPALLP